MDELDVVRVLVVFCGGCAAFGAYIASAKRRSAVEGLIFGGMLGPIGLLLLAMLPARVPPEKPAEPDELARINPRDWEASKRFTRGRSGRN